MCGWHGDSFWQRQALACFHTWKGPGLTLCSVKGAWPLPWWKFPVIQYQKCGISNERTLGATAPSKPFFIVTVNLRAIKLDLLMMLLCLWQTQPFLRITVVYWVCAEVKLLVIYVLQEAGKKMCSFEFRKTKMLPESKSPYQTSHI